MYMQVCSHLFDLFEDTHTHTNTLTQHTHLLLQSMSPFLTEQKMTRCYSLQLLPTPFPQLQEKSSWSKQVFIAAALE